MGGEVQSAWTSGSYGGGGFLFYVIICSLIFGCGLSMYFTKMVPKDTLIHIGFNVG